MKPAQGEALLNVYEECQNVTAAWNQRSLVARNSKRKTGAVKTLQKDMDAAYREALEKLNIEFVDALFLGVQEDKLTKVLIDNLPTAALNELMKK